MGWPKGKKRSAATREKMRKAQLARHYPSNVFDFKTEKQADKFFGKKREENGNGDFKTAVKQEIAKTRAEIDRLGKYVLKLEML